jgi:hypothetical protein
MFGLTNSLEAKVEALEDIAVPAGKFRCFKALVNGMGDPMTVWYSADASRTMVKFSYQKVYAELAQINSTGPQPTTYRGEDGFSFVAPAGWIVGEPQQPADGGTLIQLTDPEGQATGVWVYRLPRNPGAPNQPDETIAQKEKRAASNDKLNYKYRQGGTQWIHVKNYQGWRSIADYTTADHQSKVEWALVVQTAKTIVNVWGEGIDPADVDSFATRIQPLVDSLVVP